MALSYKTQISAILLLTAMISSGLEAQESLTAEARDQLKVTPISSERLALEQRIYDMLYEGVAPVDERERVGGAFGIAFGEPFVSASGEGMVVTPPAPHDLLNQYTVNQSDQTNIVYEIAATRQFKGLLTLPKVAACKQALNTIVKELKTSYPKSFVLMEQATLFVLTTADAQIHVLCDTDHQLSVTYVADMLGRIAGEESEDFWHSNINPNMKPFLEREKIQPAFGVIWDQPFEPPELLPMRDTMFDYLPPEKMSEADYDFYKLGVGNYDHIPWLLTAEKAYDDAESCFARAKSEAATLREQYPSAFWTEDYKEDHYYGFAAYAADGVLKSTCRYHDGRYRFITFHFPYTNPFREDSVVNGFIYDAASLILGEPTLFEDSDEGLVNARRIRKLYEQLK